MNTQDGASDDDERRRALEASFGAVAALAVDGHSYVDLLRRGMGQRSVDLESSV